jgi:hypothetical protein
MTRPNALLQGVASEWFGPPVDRVQFVKQKLKVDLWSGQQRIMASVAKNRYTAVPSAHDMGKSFMAAALTCTWLEQYDVGEAFVVTTAPTTPQVNAIIWREIEKLHRRGGLRGTIGMGRIPEWKVGKEMIAYGRKPADEDEEGFQGIHAPRVLVIVDEASGIPEQLWTAVDALATNENARVLAIGNPDDAQSYFRTICLPGSGWNVVRLDGLYSPNFTEREVKAVSNTDTTGDLYGFMADNNIPWATEDVSYELRQGLLSPLWAAERLKKWGVFKDSAGLWQTTTLWESRVRGRFTTSAADGVIPLAWVMAAVERWKEFMASGAPLSEVPGARVYGVDVAREGSDETCVAERIGSLVLGVERYAKQDTMTTALRVNAKLKRVPGSRSIVDVVGVGGGVVDRLRELEDEVVSFNGSERTDMRTHDNEFSFNNKRSAAWWNVREMLDPYSKGSKLMLPDDEFLIADLTAPKYRVAAGAKIVVEEKAETKKRLRRSPDTGDAVVMDLWLDGIEANWEPINVAYGTQSEFVASYAQPKESEYTYGVSIFDDVFAGFTGGGLRD